MILIFGGTGYIGKNLSTRLRALRKNVTVVSRNPDRAFLERHAPGAEVVTFDTFLSDPNATLWNCRAAVYLASQTTPGSNLLTPWEEARQSVEPALRIFSEVSRHAGPHLIYLSSGGAIYGDTDGTPATEDAPKRPMSPYGLAKAMCEDALDFFARNHGLTATVLRPANPIGRWQTNRSQGVVGALMRAAQTGERFKLIGDGATIRDYFAVEDLVEAILSVAAAPEVAAGRTFNVGSGVGRTTHEMIALVEAATGRDIARDTLPARASDPRHIVLDSSAITQSLGWRPQVFIEDCLAALWSDYQTGR